MRISDEKRCEIAASLRESREFISGLPKASLEQNALDTFERILACVDYEQGNIFDYLADLIDPTCNMDVMTTGERADYECSEHIMRCLNCGAEFGYVLYGEDGDVSMDDKPNYCPHCGTRVVSDDD